MSRSKLLLTLLFFSLTAVFLIFGQGPRSPGSGIYPETCSPCASAALIPDTGSAPRYKVKIVGTFPHDPDAFTEGLVFSDGFMYESTGLNGKSSLRKIELETGKILKRLDLPARIFGEGLTEWKGTLIQLTWHEEKGFVYDRETFSREREFSYSGEGWGLTHDGTSLIMSNGSDRLTYLNPQTFQPERVLPVLSGAGRYGF